jgi:tRNA 5-methylaminomethyl-2-thiouridine biosynthesis bifunctional protein
MPEAADATSPILWEGSGPPRSRLYGDLYFSRDDGLAESRTVFLEGCGLPAAWAGRRRFTVAELGFGAGLNILALLDLWAHERPDGGHLSIFSVEAHPLARGDAARVAAAWPELAPVADLLIPRWPGRARGCHRVDLAPLHATLDVAVLEVAEALSGWSGAADAWFLDGFAPALNPAMWREDVLRLIAARSAPGARAATYTIAGTVRRGLAAAGFEVRRRPGFGAKRERLEAMLPGAPPAEGPAPRVAIIGAGIAGAALARAFAAHGVTAEVFGDEGASTGPAALAAPRLDAGLGSQAELFARAMARAGALYDAVPRAVISRGAVQLATGPKDDGRFDRIAASDLFEPGELTRLSSAEAEAVLGEKAPEGLAMALARVVDPAAILAAWRPSARTEAISRLDGEGRVWRLVDTAGEVIREVEIVCLAAGMACAALWPGLRLTPVRGQASHARGAAAPAVAALFGAYVMPSRDGVVFGATHDRDDTEIEARASDHARNRAAVAAGLPSLAARLNGVELDAHTGVRATTSDFLPLAGAAPGGEARLFLLTGLGSRGFTLAPLLAEHVAALALGAPSPLPATVSALVDPARFATRAARKGRPRPRVQ